MKYFLIFIVGICLIGCTKKQVNTVLQNYPAKNVVETVEKDLPEVLKHELPALPEKRVIINETIFFDFDRSNIRANQVEKLDVVVGMLRLRPDIVINLKGGTCEIGPWEYNKKLGYRRGKSVYVYLSQRLKNEILITSVGEDEPVSKTDLWKNRRCEIKTE